MVDLEKLKLRKDNICDCGRRYVINDIHGLQDINDSHYFGGVVKYYSHAKCPQCGKDVILLLRQIGQTYEVVGVAEEKENILTIKTENIEDIIENKEEEEDKTEVITENEEENKYVCDVCGKSFKSKSGLTSHAKTHSK